MLVSYQDRLRAGKFASRSFSPTESRWPTTHQELFGVKWGLEQFRYYILGRKIKVVTDHANLRWLTSISPKQSKLARWCISTAEFDFTIEHRAGKEHVVPDTLSRAPLPNPSVVGDSLVIAPPEVSAFLITALGYDVPGHTTTFVSQVFDPALQCIALSCDVNPPSFSPLPDYVFPTHKAKVIPISEVIPQIDHPVQPSSASWPPDLNNLHPLNISRTSFAEQQQRDKWLGPPS